MTPKILSHMQVCCVRGLDLHVPRIFFLFSCTRLSERVGALSGQERRWAPRLAEQRLQFQMQGSGMSRSRRNVRQTRQTAAHSVTRQSACCVDSLYVASACPCEKATLISLARSNAVSQVAIRSWEYALRNFLAGIPHGGRRDDMNMSLTFLDCLIEAR